MTDTQNPRSRTRRQRLTGAELEMVELFAEGLTDLDIAAHFGRMTRAGVFDQFEEMLRKRKVGSRAELVEDVLA